MNPLSLLTKGQTFQGLKDRPCVYKLPPRSTLPNFSALKKQEPRQESRPAGDAVAPPPNLFGAKSPTTSHPAPEPPKTPVEENPVAPTTPVPEFGGTVRPPAPSVDILSRLARFCGLFFRKWMPKRRGLPGQAPSVQAELALEKITVVRNDLSEEEMEVVPVEMKTWMRKPAEKPRPGNLVTNS
jgi:hypothetical protein